MEHHPLPLDDWQDTKIALHCMLQIVGKIKMALHPKRNHWWHVTLYVSAHGLTTGPIPYNSTIFQIDFDFINHQCFLKSSQGEQETFSLSNLSVSDFYKQLFAKLIKLNIKVSILAKPFDASRVQTDIPFAENNTHHYSNFAASEQFWRLLLWIYPIFQSFAGGFSGKTTPVHLYWHSMDYVVTRFSGRKAPKVEGMDSVSKEAYSHEVISFGFWPGDNNLREPAFYSYAYPTPEGLMQELLSPNIATWIEANDRPMALLKYHDLIQLDKPNQAVIEFLQSAFDAGSKLATWKKISSS